MTTFNQFQTLKRRFFAMRNGIIADTLRRAGSPFKIIFGLNMPQLDEIAAEFGHDSDLARRLWENNSTRESMLLAPMLMNPEEITADAAARMIDEAPVTEVIDVVCHKLLRRHPDSYAIALKLLDSQSDARRYAAMRLLWHHIYNKELSGEIYRLAQAETSRNCPLTRPPAQQIIDELDFLADE